MASVRGRNRRWNGVLIAHYRKGAWRTWKSAFCCTRIWCYVHPSGSSPFRAVHSRSGVDNTAEPSAQPSVSMTLNLRLVENFGHNAHDCQ